MTQRAGPRDEEVVSHTNAQRATASMPIIGEQIVVMGDLYRCVSVTYVDEQETQTGAPEIRVRFKQESPSDA